MKGILAAFFLTAMMSAMAVAQDPAAARGSGATQPAMVHEDEESAAQTASATGSMPDPGSSVPASTRKYGAEGYGHRAEVFVTGFGLFGNHPSGNAISEQMTDAAGAAAGYRFHLNSSSALEGRYGFSRNSQKYTVAGSVSSIPSYFSEISGSYVYSFAHSQRLRPFLEGGGGVALFSPASYNAPAAATNGTSALGGTPSGYALPTFHAEDVTAPAYSGSSAGVGRQARGMFLYGAGADLAAFPHFYFRTEFRGLGYATPDFRLNALRSNAFGFSYEPSVGIAYRF
jgi:hypothetical protein